MVVTVGDAGFETEKTFDNLTFTIHKHHDISQTYTSGNIENIKERQFHSGGSSTRE